MQDESKSVALERLSSSDTREESDGGLIELEEGIYEGQSYPEYDRVRGVRSGHISTIRNKTPAHLVHAILNPKEPTPALLLGLAGHTLILEPELYAKRYAREPEPDFKKYANPRASKKHKEAVEGMKSDGFIVLTTDQDDAAHGMRKALRRRKGARAILDAPGLVEVTIVWRDPVTGVWCKARADKLLETHGGTHVDLKTTKSAEFYSFQRDMWKLGYIIRAGFYRMGLTHLASQGIGPGCEHTVFLCVENTPPFEPAIYEVDGDRATFAELARQEGHDYDPGAAALEVGENLARMYLNRIADCLETNEWPGYPETIESISLPSWAWKLADEECGIDGGGP